MTGISVAIALVLYLSGRRARKPQSEPSSWERFVAAVRRLQENAPELGLRLVDESNAFPVQTTSVPEMAITLGPGKGRLWFRWRTRR